MCASGGHAPGISQFAYGYGYGGAWVHGTEQPSGNERRTQANSQERTHSLASALPCVTCVTRTDTSHLAALSVSVSRAPCSILQYVLRRLRQRSGECTVRRLRPSLGMRGAGEGGLRVGLAKRSSMRSLQQSPLDSGSSVLVGALAQALPHQSCAKPINIHAPRDRLTASRPHVHVHVHAMYKPPRAPR